MLEALDHPIGEVRSGEAAGRDITASERSDGMSRRSANALSNTQVVRSKIRSVCSASARKLAGYNIPMRRMLPADECFDRLHVPVAQPRLRLVMQDELHPTRLHDRARI